MLADGLTDAQREELGAFEVLWRSLHMGTDMDECRAFEAAEAEMPEAGALYMEIAADLLMGEIRASIGP